MWLNGKTVFQYILVLLSKGENFIVIVLPMQ